MQMTTSGYISAFQGLRAFGDGGENTTTITRTNINNGCMVVEEEREVAVAKAETIRDVVMVQRGGRQMSLPVLRLSSSEPSWRCTTPSRKTNVLVSGLPTRMCDSTIFPSDARPGATKR